MDEWLGVGLSGSVQRSAPEGSDAAIDADSYAEQLRRWARGDSCVEAATEMLIRGFGGRFATSGQPWIELGNGRGASIDFDAIPDGIGPLAGGERSYLLLAASIAQGGLAVSLGRHVTRLDHRHFRLLLAGITHAGGFDVETVGMRENADHSLSGVSLPALYSWPDEPGPVAQADE